MLAQWEQELVGQEVGEPVELERELLCQGRQQLEQGQQQLLGLGSSLELL